MVILLFFIIITAMYVLGYTHGYKECEWILQSSLNRLIEEVKVSEEFKIGSYEWEQQENMCHTDDGQEKKKKS